MGERLSRGLQILAHQFESGPGLQSFQLLIPRDVDIDLFHRREIRHRVGAVRAVVRVPQGARDAFHLSWANKLPALITRNATAMKHRDGIVEPAIVKRTVGEKHSPSRAYGLEVYVP